MSHEVIEVAHVVNELNTVPAAVIIVSNGVGVSSRIGKLVMNIKY